MVARSEIGQQTTTLFAGRWEGKGLSSQAMWHVDKFLISSNLNPVQVEDFGSRAREICEKKGQEVPGGLLSNLAGLYLFARQVYGERTSNKEQAMEEFRKIHVNLPAGVLSGLEPVILIIQREVPIPPSDSKRAERALALPSETPFGHVETTRYY